MSNNTITLCGRVGQPPVLKRLDNGKTVAELSIAVKEYAPDGADSTMWINVELWNGLSERASKVITIGREIIVTGRLVVQKYTRKIANNEVKSVKCFVRARDFHLCGPKAKTADSTLDSDATTSDAEPLETAHEQSA